MILQVYSRDVGQRSALMGFSVGQGSQDIGFRNDTVVVFTAAPADAVRAPDPRRERRASYGLLPDQGPG